MKIILSALNAKYVHSNLAIYDIEAYTRKKWKEIQGEEHIGLFLKEFTINHNLDYILQELYREKADVYAFSCYIWNISEILTITKELKKVLPKAKIWFGGPEVSYEGKKYLQKNPFLEGIILGEGEVTFYELTKAWKDRTKGTGLAYQDIAGIVYRDRSGDICETEKRPLMALDELPFVYEELERFEHKILYYETSRGCPFSCSYCLSSIDKKVRFRSFSLVEKELAFFLEHKVPQVKFVDRTFNCNKKHALEIWNYITEHDNGVTNFHFEIAADLIGEEELSIFQKMRPGLIQLEIGLQSTNPQTIQEIRRVMDVEKVKSTLLKIRSFGNIHQHLDLIAGLPYEDFESFQKSFQDAYEMKPNQLQLGFLKILKGSYMGEQTENYELQYREVQPYEVLSTKWISYDEILKLKMVEEMVEVYYNSDQFEHILPYVISFFPSPYDFYENLGQYYEEKELFGIGFKRENRYQVLRNFFREINEKKEDETSHIESRMKIFDSLLTFDFYLRENAKTRPAWAKEEPIEKSVYYTFFKNGGNEEVSLFKEGYDFKVAARKMHIEPIATEALIWLKDKVQEGQNKEEWRYCLFDYDNRNPLTKDAKVVFMGKL